MQKERWVPVQMDFNLSSMTLAYFRLVVFRDFLERFQELIIDPLVIIFAGLTVWDSGFHRPAADFKER